VEAYGHELPFLLKILDARQMLSIQAHPNRAQAQAGFAREEAAGIPVSAPGRNYKDPHPKPEVQVALTPFWMLHGFRRLEELADETERHPELRAVWSGLADRVRGVRDDQSGRTTLLRHLYEQVMRLPQPEVDAILRPLLDRLRRTMVQDRSDRRFWLQRAATSFAPAGACCDRGLFSLFMLNLVQLEPGQSTFQDAGVLHAYLEGTTVELMAGSDNVLRGGLTPKHVDVEELLNVVRFEEQVPSISAGTPVSARETVFPTPAKEFELSRLTVAPGERWTGRATNGPECLVVLGRTLKVTDGSVTETLARGQSVWLNWGVEYSLHTPDSEAAVVFRARVAVGSF
jgi:mannose-6-phosphate isomerase